MVCVQLHAFLTLPKSLVLLLELLVEGPFLGIIVKKEIGQLLQMLLQPRFMCQRKPVFKKSISFPWKMRRESSSRNSVFSNSHPLCTGFSMLVATFVISPIRLSRVITSYSTRFSAV